MQKKNEKMYLNVVTKSEKRGPYRVRIGISQKLKSFVRLGHLLVYHKAEEYEIIGKKICTKSFAKINMAQLLLKKPGWSKLAAH